MHSRLEFRSVRDARIEALQRPLTKWRGGLVLDDDVKLRHRRKNAPFDSFQPDAKFPRRLAGDYIYGGGFQPHFGHFMAETVHRIVPSKLLWPSQAQWLFVTAINDPKFKTFRSLPGFARDVFQLLGLNPAEITLLSKNTVADQVFVAELGSELGVGPKPGYLDDLREYVTPRLDTLFGNEARPEKVYVSRRALWGGNFLGERYLEDQLAAEGFHILQPETLPITVQLDTYRKAKVLVFNEGSACHGTELLGALPNTYLLARRKWSVTFDCVLEPRAARFAKSEGHQFLGTIVRDRRMGQPLNPRGMSLFNIPRLLAFFRHHGIAALRSFDTTAYARAAENHVHAYIESARASQDVMCSDEELRGFLQAFAKAKNDFCAAE